MKYLLDTNTASDLFNTDSVSFFKLQHHLSSVSEQDTICVSILTLYELEYGFSNAPESLKPQLQAKIRIIQSAFSILLLLETGTRIFGDLKTFLRSQKNLSKERANEHNIDLMIASTAIAENCTLISADSVFSILASFNDNLCIEDWTK